VEEFVWRKLAILLYLNITNIDIVIITEQKFILESKADKSLKIYKNPYNNKNLPRAEVGLCLNSVHTVMKENEITQIIHCP
tara:strand:- start:323 stop:565 length:243 start_codon:yes stop_codon:yes gene_type:complete